MDGLWWMTILQGGSHLGEELRRRLLLNLLLRPLLILWVQLDLALVHCPSINGNNPEGEIDKQTNNTCASNKGKQTNKQTNERRWHVWKHRCRGQCRVA